MEEVLHITSGDIAGANLEKSGVAGEILVWHDMLYDGPRQPGWPSEEMLATRALFLEDATGGGLDRSFVLETLKSQYEKLTTVSAYAEIDLWFDACLFDQAMLCHILACLSKMAHPNVRLICVDAFPGIEPFHGVGQIPPDRFASLLPSARRVTAAQYGFAEEVDAAFATKDQAAFGSLAGRTDAPLPWIPAAVARWQEEQPDGATGLGRLERLALEAIDSGCDTPDRIFAYTAEHETPPQYWGDSTLWGKINGLAMRTPPLVRIEGPTPMLPQWNCQEAIRQYKVYRPDRGN